MLVKVDMMMRGSDVPSSCVEIECGAGEQILRWIGYTACARLAMEESNMMGMYMPHVISDKLGTQLDPNFVVNEVVEDQQTLIVQYGDGPEAFTGHIPARAHLDDADPDAPGADGSHAGSDAAADAARDTRGTHPGAAGSLSTGTSSHWLESLDLSLYGMQEFISKDITTSNPEMVRRDLEATKEILLQYGGIVQLFFFYYATIDSTTSATSAASMKMNLPSFRNFCLDCHTTTDNFKVKKIDAVYERAMALTTEKTVTTTVTTTTTTNAAGQTTTATSTTTTEDAGGTDAGERPAAAGSADGDASQKSSATTTEAPLMTAGTAVTMGMKEFFIALVTLAGLKFEMGVENPTWGYAELSLKLSHLLTDYVLPSLVPSFDERLAMLDAAITAPHVREVCEKGRRLTKTSMDRCCLVRGQSITQNVDFSRLWMHVTTWSAIGDKLDFCSVIQVYCWAKLCAAYGKKPIRSAVESIMRIPLFNTHFDLDYDEYELFLVGLGTRLYNNTVVGEAGAASDANVDDAMAATDAEATDGRVGGGDDDAADKSSLAEFMAKFLNTVYTDAGIVEKSIDDNDDQEDGVEE